MGSSAQNSVHYCCVWKGGRAAYAYHGSGGGGGTPEITEALAKSCLELTPPHHRWYIERMGERAFGFLMEDGYVYFLISDHAFRNKAILAFLHHLRDEFIKRKSTDQLVPVIHRLVTSLANVSSGGGGASELSPSPGGNAEVANAPLLGRSEKKKKKKEHVIGIELEGARKSTSSSRELNRQTSSNSSSSSTVPQLRSASSRNLHVRKRWCRQVKIVIAVDVAVCLVLLGVWLGICRGFKCIS